MGKGERPKTLGRISISVPADIQREAPERAELLGLPAGASRKKVIETLLVRGWNSFLQAEAERAQIELYRAYEQDPERREVARAMQEELRRSTVV
jgi:hypothetical protein